MIARLVQAIALIGVGVVLLVAHLTAPQPATAEPWQWRTATEADDREWERRQLAEAVAEARTK